TLNKIIVPFLLSKLVEKTPIKMKLSKWLEKNLENNLKNTLEETIENLLQLDPPINKKAPAHNQKKALTSSLKSLLKNNESKKEYEPLRIFFSISERKQDNKRKLKIIEKENRAVFKKARIFSKFVNISYGTALTSIQNSSINREFGVEQKRNLQDKQEKVREIKHVHRSSPLASERESSPPIPQRFSFSSLEQGSYVEPILQYVERALFRFIASNEEYIPLKVVKNFTSKCNPPRQVNFSDADLFCILNFIIQNITLFTTGNSNQTLFHGEYALDPSELFKSFNIEARNHNAHAITQPMGRWSDEELQRLSTLALKVIVCLGDKESFDPLVKIKCELDNKLIERLSLTTDHQKRFNKVVKIANQEDEDEYHADLVDFALDIINKLKSSKEEHVKQILQLAINKDSTFMNIYKSLVIRKDKSDKSVIVEKFIAIMNIQYNMNLEVKKV
ncbi:14329_t:CDS:2, partial [Funneliformis geosporum]